MKPALSLFLSLASACNPEPQDTQPDTTVQAPGTAIVLVAAGYTAQQGPPDDPDAISEATTNVWNTQAFADRLVDMLQDRDVDTTAVDWIDCKDLACLHVPDASVTTDIAVFAGPTHWGVFPDQIRDLPPAIAELSPPPGVCSALNSYETAGEYAVTSFLADLEELGLATVQGLALEGGVTQTEEHVDAELEGFAGRLMGD